MPGGVLPPLRVGNRQGFQSELVPISVLGRLEWMAEVARLYLVSEALGFFLDLPLLVFVTLASAMLTLVSHSPPEAWERWSGVELGY